MSFQPQYFRCDIPPPPCLTGTKSSLSCLIIDGFLTLLFVMKGRFHISKVPLRLNALSPWRKPCGREFPRRIFLNTHILPHQKFMANLTFRDKTSPDIQLRAYFTLHVHVPTHTLFFWGGGKVVTSSFFFFFLCSLLAPLIYVHGRPPRGR